MALDVGENCCRIALESRWVAPARFTTSRIFIVSIAGGLQVSTRLLRTVTSTVLVDTLESYVEVVLNALDHPEALVTDLSTIGDFGLDDDERSAASAKLGLRLSDDDYVYEIARRLRDKEESCVEFPETSDY